MMRHAQTLPFVSPSRAPPPSPQLPHPPHPPHPTHPPLLHENYLSSNPISLQLQPSPTASRRISSGCALHPLRQVPSPVASSSSSSATPPPTAIITTAAATTAAAPPTNRPFSPDHAEAEKPETEKEKNVDAEPELDRDKETATTAKKRKMPIINPLVTLPMWPSKSPASSTALSSSTRSPAPTSALHSFKKKKKKTIKTER